MYPIAMYLITRAMVMVRVSSDIFDDDDDDEHVSGGKVILYCILTDRVFMYKLLRNSTDVYHHKVVINYGCLSYDLMEVL